MFSFGIVAKNADSVYAISNYHRYFADGQKVKDPVKEKSIGGMLLFLLPFMMQAATWSCNATRKLKIWGNAELPVPLFRTNNW